MSAPLASLAAVQAWLGQTDDGPALAGLLDAVSRAILSYLGRPCVLPARYDELYEPHGRSSILLRQWPVLSVTSVRSAAIASSGRRETLGLFHAGVPAWSLEPSDAAPPGRMQTLSFRDPHGLAACGALRIRYEAGYRATDAVRVPSAPGPFVVAARQADGAFAKDLGVVDASGAALTAGAESAPGIYTVAQGVYAFDAADAGRALRISYAYVPSDLAQAALEWTAERYVYRNRIGQRSKSLGGQETVSYDISAVPSFVASLLQPYRRVATPC